MSYFFIDVKKLYRAKLVRYMITLLLIIMIADPIFNRIQSLQYSNSTIPSNPFLYWIMFPMGIGNRIYMNLFWWLPVISTGLVFYSEQNSSVLELSVIRGNWRRYYFSKILSLFLFTFISFFILFIVNILVTYIVFDTNAPKTGQYEWYIPKEGTFAYPFYKANPVYMCILYSFINALAIALMSILMFFFQAVIKLKTKYIALLVPAVVLYAVQYTISWFMGDNDHAHLLTIVQPLIAGPVTNTITTLSDVISTYTIIAIIDFVFILIGYFREKELI